MDSIVFFFCSYLPYLIGGGRIQYRVRPIGSMWRIEQRCDGMGWTWRFAKRAESDFESLMEARKLAIQWAFDDDGVFVGDRPTYHLHSDENGFLVRCYHKSKSTLLSFNFWLGVTLSFPLEHAIWTKLWPFYIITEYFHLLHD